MSEKKQKAVALLTDDERARLDHWARAEGVSMSTAIRRWVRSLPGPRLPDPRDAFVEPTAVAALDPAQPRRT